MDLRDHLFALVAPLGLGDELLPGVRLRGASVEAGCQLDFEVAGQLVEVEIAPLSEGGPAAARTAKLRIYFHGQSEHGVRICNAVAERAKKNEARVLASLPEEGEAGRVREVRVTHLLEAAQGYHRLSPYVGCTIGCRFCYAQEGIARVRKWSGLPEVAWGSYVDARINAAEVLRGELDGVKVIKFCPLVSDPYQSLEAKYRITRQCLEVLAERDLSVMLLTRAKLILDDLPLLAKLPKLWAGVSIPTFDDQVREAFEPRAASVEERMTILRELRRAGVRTFAVVQPLLPGPVEEFAAALAENAQSVRLAPLQGEYSAVGDFDRYPFARERNWQRTQLEALARALNARSVPLWTSELPPESASSKS